MLRDCGFFLLDHAEAGDGEFELDFEFGLREGVRWLHICGIGWRGGAYEEGWLGRHDGQLCDFLWASRVDGRFLLEDVKCKCN